MPCMYPQQCAPLLRFDPAVLSSWADLLGTTVIELGVDRPELCSGPGTHSNWGSWMLPHKSVTLHEKVQKNKTVKQDSQTAFITPRTPAVVEGKVSAGRSLVRHIVLFRSRRRRMRLFGNVTCPGHRVGVLIQGGLTRRPGSGRVRRVRRSRLYDRGRALGLIQTRDGLGRLQQRSWRSGACLLIWHVESPVICRRRGCHVRGCRDLIYHLRGHER
jgi:hypothetical protein